MYCSKAINLTGGNFVKAALSGIIMSLYNKFVRIINALYDVSSDLRYFKQFCMN